MDHSTAAYPTIKLLEIFKLNREGEAKKNSKRILETENCYGTDLHFQTGEEF